MFRAIVGSWVPLAAGPPPGRKWPMRRGPTSPPSVEVCFLLMADLDGDEMSRVPFLYHTCRAQRPPPPPGPPLQCSVLWELPPPLLRHPSAPFQATPLQRSILGGSRRPPPQDRHLLHSPPRSDIRQSSTAGAETGHVFGHRRHDHFPHSYRKAQTRSTCHSESCHRCLLACFDACGTLGTHIGGAKQIRCVCSTWGWLSSCSAMRNRTIRPGTRLVCPIAQELVARAGPLWGAV